MLGGGETTPALLFSEARGQMRYTYVFNVKRKCEDDREFAHIKKVLRVKKRGRVSTCSRSSAIIRVASMRVDRGDIPSMTSRVVAALANASSASAGDA